MTIFGCKTESTHLFDLKKIGNEYVIFINSGSKKVDIKFRDVVKIIEDNGAGELLINSIDEFTIGQFITYFMMETITACKLIGVNPFNQPAVEQGKKLMKKYLT